MTVLNEVLLVESLSLSRQRSSIGDAVHGVDVLMDGVLAEARCFDVGRNLEYLNKNSSKTSCPSVIG